MLAGGGDFFAAGWWPQPFCPSPEEARRERSTDRHVVSCRVSLCGKCLFDLDCRHHTTDVALDRYPGANRFCGQDRF